MNLHATSRPLCAFRLPLFLLGLISPILLAQDETVAGHLTVEGDADIQGDTLSLGTRSDSSTIPGINLLYLDGTGPSVYFSATRNGANWLWQQDGGKTQMKLGADNKLQLFDQSSTPLAKIILDPLGMSTFSGDLSAGGVVKLGAATTAGTTTLASTATSARTLSLPNASGTLALVQDIPVTSVTSAADSVVKANSSGKIDRSFLDLSEVASVFANGDLAIGTATPDARLTVRAPGLAINENIAHFYSSAEWPGYLVEGGTAISGLDGLKLKNSTGYQYNLGLSGGSSVLGVNNAFFIWDKMAGANRFILDSSGNVGIGTIPSEKLHVNGRAKVVELVTSDDSYVYALTLGRLGGVTPYSYIRPSASSSGVSITNASASSNALSIVSTTNGGRTLINVGPDHIGATDDGVNALQVRGSIKAYSTTSSTSANTGSGIFAGGLGVAENINAGGSISAGSALKLGATTSASTTTLVSTATAARSISLPNASGTLALVQDIPVVSTVAAANSAVKTNSSGKIDNSFFDFSSTSLTASQFVGGGAGLTGLNASNIAVGTGAVTLQAGGANQNITLAPSGTGILNLVKTASSGVREPLLRASVSDAGNDQFMIANATFVDGKFAPTFAGYAQATTSLVFMSLISPENDIGTGGATMVWNARRTDLPTDPMNGVFSTITTRPLFQWQSDTSIAMTMAADLSLKLVSAVPSTSPGTGSLVTAGGLGVAGNVNSGGSVTAGTTLKLGAASVDNITTLTSTATAARSISLPNASGTLALVQDIPVASVTGTPDSFVKTNSSGKIDNSFLDLSTVTNLNGVSISGGSSPVLAVTGSVGVSGNNTGDQYGGAVANAGSQYLRRNAGNTAYEFADPGFAVGPNGVVANRIALFDGTSGKLIKQSSALMESGNYLGVGTNNPATALDVVSENGTAPIYSRSFSNTPSALGGVTGYRARGSAASPAAIQTGDLMGGILVRGYDGSSFQTTSGGRIIIQAEENWSPSAKGTSIIFGTTPSGTTAATTKMTLSGSGVLNLSSAISSTSPVTGTLTVGGGLGIAENINAGGNISAGSALKLGAATAESTTTLVSTATAARSISLPNASGTLALAQDIPVAVTTATADSLVKTNSSGKIDPSFIDFPASPVFTGGSEGLTLNAGGTNQNINIKPSGTGKVQIGTAAAFAALDVGAGIKMSGDDSETTIVLNGEFNYIEAPSADLTEIKGGGELRLKGNGDVHVATSDDYAEDTYIRLKAGTGPDSVGHIVLDAEVIEGSAVSVASAPSRLVKANTSGKIDSSYLPVRLRIAPSGDLSMGSFTAGTNPETE